MATDPGCSWIDKLLQAEKTGFSHNGKRKVHYKFKDGQEMAEEYDLKTNVLTVRKWREKTTIGRLGQWQIEVGEPAHCQKQSESDGLQESTENPIFYRLDTQTNFQWKIRNLPYPISNYEVSVDQESRQVVIKTLNKKFYKRFSILDLDRCKLNYDGSKLSVIHRYNTLIIEYEKPSEILSIEATLQRELSKLKDINKEGPDDCQTS